MKIELSFDDGDELDLKVIQLLEKYDLKGVFYIPNKSWGYENINVYKNHEVGGHTYNHPQDMKLLDDLGLYAETSAAKNVFEVFSGRQLTKFCFPRGRYDDRVIEAVKKAGFSEARTTKVLHTYSELADLRSFIKHTAVHMYPRKEYEGDDWLLIAKEFIKEGGDRVVRIWGHAEELNRYQEWDKFEQLLKEINETKHS